MHLGPRQTRRSAVAVMTAVMIAVTIAAGAAPAARAADPVRIVGGPDYPPFVDPKLPRGGMMTEIVVAAFAAAGTPTAPVAFEPWKRGYTSVLAGKYDATYAYVRTEEREREMLYSESLFDVDSVAVFAAASGRTYAGPESLKGLTLCVVLGYAIDTAVEHLVRSGALAVSQNQSIEGCLRQIEIGRVDVFIGNRISTLQTLRDALGGGGSLSVADRPVQRIPHHLVAAKANPRAAEIVAAFDRGLALLRADDRWRTIVERHLPAGN